MRINVMKMSFIQEIPRTTFNKLEKVTDDG